jgi:pSer/pThr/pTyr-binding forkhead associated (FHA) protein
VPTQRGWQVQDTGSTNGTFVNGRELGTRPYPLRGNEDIAFGSVVTRFLR